MLNRSKMIVLENMQNPDFTITMFAEEIGISVSMLNRKMKALIGITPNDFIKHLRIIKASELLNSKSFNVSEVAHQCGFNDISYFGVCFKKQYGVSPSNYVENRSGKS